MRPAGGTCDCRCDTGRGSRDAAKDQAHAGALAGLAFDLEIGAVPLRDAVHHGEPEARAARALGGEERLEAAAARVLVHADAGVDDLEHHARLAARRRAMRADGERAALRAWRPPR